MLKDITGSYPLIQPVVSCKTGKVYLSFMWFQSIRSKVESEGFKYVFMFEYNAVFECSLKYACMCLCENRWRCRVCSLLRPWVEPPKMLSSLSPSSLTSCGKMWDHQQQNYIFVIFLLKPGSLNYKTLFSGKLTYTGAWHTVKLYETWSSLGFNSQ